MYYDLVEIKYIEGYTLELTFENGKKGVVNFQNYVNKVGVFSRFSNVEYFKKAYINPELGVLCWPDGLDVAPEILYSRATGDPLPEWMSKEIDDLQKVKS